ncbi:glycosyltransferase family 1 protein [Planctomycetales bacterium ZRK34]|nr:glycosyltransferase family 1 protein [Planctomycetales bacterium ZRK34]
MTTQPDGPSLQPRPKVVDAAVRHKHIVGDGPADGVIWYGNVDWWYHNRGHASTRMATRLAARVPTCWVNSIGMRMPKPGKTDLAWTRYWRKFKTLFKGLKRDPDTGMYVYSPFFVPLYSDFGLKLNATLLAIQVRIVRWRLGIKRPSACVSMPTMTPAMLKLSWVSVVFDRCDDFTTLPEADRASVAKLEEMLLNASDHAAYVNVPLYEREKDHVADAQLIGHGVDFDQFAEARPIGGQRVATPDVLKDIPRPIVGFYGGMDDYRMDRDLMIKIAKHLQPKGGSLVLFGPAQMDLAPVLREPNAHHMGQLPPQKLAEHAAQFDVGIIPFFQNEFNELCNPTKLKEYLALSFPIVTMRLPAFEPHEDFVYLCDSHDEFLAAIDRALVEDDVELAKKRRQAVAGDSWDKISDMIAKMLEVQ